MKVHRVVFCRVGFIASLGAILLLSGCASPAHRIDPQGSKLITRVTKLDEQDAADAAAELAGSLLDAGVLGREGKPSSIAIDRVVDATGQSIDPDRITKKLRVALNKAGVSQTMTTINRDGEIGGESAIASAAAGRRLRNNQIDAFLNETVAPEAISPDFALSFKMLRSKSVSVGLLWQTIYTFQMTLTDTQTGLAVWEEEKQIAKQGRWSSAGK